MEKEKLQKCCRFCGGKMILGKQKSRRVEFDTESGKKIEYLDKVFYCENYGKDWRNTLKYFFTLGFGGGVGHSRETVFYENNIPYGSYQSCEFPAYD